ncbi:hypothetical protein [Lutibaculum baratangense]|uniref:Uncharacterized protein n=1 Tax=Lutibaculum baratangense AMV1 TaxID=631454 RepID=V4RHI5_9HYPH|nr:hypothetical protein [Lutibaculum baratangense]ESR22735.1 hypothetical protein N177_3872 [Lutibaculum baratangense AMV1]
MRRPIAVLAAGLLCSAAGVGVARADCGWDIQMTVGEIAEVEGAIPLAENPRLPLGPGTELPPQQRSTRDGESETAAEGAEGFVSGATPSGQEVVPDAAALTGHATEGAVPGPAEETVAASPDPEGGLLDAPSAQNEAARHLAGAKLKVRDARAAWDRGDRQACYGEIDQAKDLVARARAAIAEAAKGGA